MQAVKAREQARAAMFMRSTPGCRTLAGSQPWIYTKTEKIRTKSKSEASCSANETRQAIEGSSSSCPAAVPRMLDCLLRPLIWNIPLLWYHSLGVCWKGTGSGRVGCCNAGGTVAHLFGSPCWRWRPNVSMQNMSNMHNMMNMPYFTHLPYFVYYTYVLS